jgi:hypothetical protein
MQIKKERDFSQSQDRRSQMFWLKPLPVLIVYPQLKLGATKTSRMNNVTCTENNLFKTSKLEI